MRVQIIGSGMAAGAPGSGAACTAATASASTVANQLAHPFIASFRRVSVASCGGATLPRAWTQHVHHYTGARCGGGVALSRATPKQQQ